MSVEGNPDDPRAGDAAAPPSASIGPADATRRHPALEAEIADDEGEAEDETPSPARLGPAEPTRRHSAIDAEILGEGEAEGEAEGPGPAALTVQPALGDTRNVTASATQRLQTVNTTAVGGEWYHREGEGPATIELKSGMVLDDKYRLDRLIGRGGMGHVWRCTHTHMVGEVAVKILIDRLRRKQSAIDRFWQEARLMGALGHPNIVKIFDVSPSTAPVPYMAMELLEQDSLRARLKREKTIEPDEALRLLDGVLSALIAAHKRGIIHRDVKPENLMFAQVRDIHTDEVRTELKVLDFGASILLDPDATSESPEGIFGTPYYMSPEQAAGAPLDLRTDLYSAAVVLYEMISSKLPHEGDGVHALVFNIATEPPIPLRDRCPDLPPPYFEFFEKALARDADDRFQTAEAMRAALRELSGQLVRRQRHTELYLNAIPDSPLPPPPKPGDTGPVAPFRSSLPIINAITEDPGVADDSEEGGSTERLVGGGSLSSGVAETIQVRPSSSSASEPASSTVAPLGGGAIARVAAIAVAVGAASAAIAWQTQAAQADADWGVIGLAGLLPTLLVGVIGFWWLTRGD
ncbi:MAG: serine/threonine protein kinase [Myxococcales bacterium]|nr:serine/threonine protein kinase [Myxococcales bacterium]